MILKKYILIIVIVTSAFINNSNAQLVKGKIYNSRITKAGDTILTIRTPGNWWTGVFGNATYSKYFGDFMFPQEIIVGLDEYDDTLKYDNSAYFPGLTLGILTEYYEPNSRWGLGFQLGLMDFIKNKTVNKLGDSLRTEFINEAQFDYISTAFFGKYEFSDEHTKILDGLYLIGGLNLEVPIKAFTNHTKAIYNPVRIEETIKYKFKEPLVRGNLIFGLGLDLFDANIEKGGRTIFSPFITASIGTNMMRDFSSKFYSLNMKLGFSLKIIIDEKKYDTLKYVPKEDPKIIPQSPSVTESPIEQLEEIITNTFEAKHLEPFFEEPFKETNIVRRLPPSVEPAFPVFVTGTEPDIEFNIQYDKKFILSYPFSQNDVDLSGYGLEFLEKVAEFMEDNDESTVTLTGFSDAMEDEAESQRLSFLRAENAKLILTIRGISSERIESSGKGSIQFIESNETEVGRNRNRRIEIVLKKSRK